MKSIFVDDNLSGYALDSTIICKENVLWITAPFSRDSLLRKNANEQTARRC